MENLDQLASPRNSANMAKQEKMLMSNTHSAVNTIFNDSDNFLRTNSQQNKKTRFAQKSKKVYPKFNEGGKNNE